MKIRKRFRGWYLKLELERKVPVRGFNSKLQDGTHILMWDFDRATLDGVLDCLEQVQLEFQLPPITVMESKKERNYHAICFQRNNFAHAAYILASTEGVDQVFVGLGFWRGYWTLRYTSKGKGMPEKIALLPGYELPDADPDDITTEVEYLAKVK